MKPELKPCPFCGKKPKTERIEDTDLKDMWIIYCDSKRCVVKPFLGYTYTTLDRALKAWNKRA